MRLRVLGCSGGSAPGAELSCYLLDDVLAIDAGALTTTLDLAGQRRVQDVLLTHGHLDHVWTLPLFLANRFAGDPVPCRLHGSSYTLETVRLHLFNDRVWPDFTASVRENVPLVQFHPVDPGDHASILDYEVDSVPLVHTVPSQGYRIRRHGRSLLICGDTYLADGLWTLANASQDLGAVLLECSFPDRYEWLAKASMHLTPKLLAAELKKLKRDVPILVTHVKPDAREEVHEELAALKDSRIRVLRQGETIPL
jgi:3',5'-cyclic-nucleotide phosphodiesterase